MDFIYSRDYELSHAGRSPQGRRREMTLKRIGSGPKVINEIGTQIARANSRRAISNPLEQCRRVDASFLVGVTSEQGGL